MYLYGVVAVQTEITLNPKNTKAQSTHLKRLESKSRAFMLDLGLITLTNLLKYLLIKILFALPA